VSTATFDYFTEIEQKTEKIKYLKLKKLLSNFVVIPQTRAHIFKAYMMTQ